MTRPARPASTRVVRAWWFTVGCGAVGIGSIGIVVPGLPTTIFFIVAAWCFGRSSPRFEQWVLTRPGIGQLVADHRAGLGMPRKAKVLALTMMWAAIVLSTYALRHRPWVVAAVVAAGVVGTAYLLVRVPTRRSCPAPESERSEPTVVS